MVRWEPGAKERLQVAALDLFVEGGYEQTTVQDIAAAAGLTERTFFRHFADKREVLFAGGAEYRATFVDGVLNAPDGLGAFDYVRAALTAAAGFFAPERRPWSRKRQRVIDANPALLERESLKRAALGEAIAGALRDRGVQDPDARLAAETGVVVFHTAFTQWIAEGEERTLLEVEQEVLDRLTAIVPA
ncbi:TetR/AcrR family transcriptional regulator [Amnibacterium sp.]|uniref:TetR/AcrR family transcriptional regulator n=1 Tax=Amnibacterium sp. TaxID=1872496 RepID=UPI003F7CCA12